MPLSSSKYAPEYRPVPGEIRSSSHQRYLQPWPDLENQCELVSLSLTKLDSFQRHRRSGLAPVLWTRAEPGKPRRSLENACFFVLAHTGLRARECVDLQVQDLDLPGRRLLMREGKGRKDRVVYLSEATAQAVAQYLERVPHSATGPLWVRRSGQPITYQWLHARIVALGHAAGLADLTPHRLRHSLATRLLNVGMEISRIQKLLGHQEINTTMIYARVHDATVEADYRRAMQQIELRPEQSTEAAILAPAWPTRPVKDICPAPAIFQSPLDNSV